MKRVLIACGNGIATSTVVVNKFNTEMENRGLKGTYTVTQCRVSEVPVKHQDYDFVIVTASVPELPTPVINGIPLLTGIGIDSVWDQAEELLRK